MAEDLIREPQSAVAEFQAGPFHARAEVRVTPAGMLALGVMISGTLLATAAVVWASTSIGRAWARTRG